ncbi:MAG: dTDP-glucose 4,6-dehydratase [Clostridiales Family XIII bacterium]|jgi:dTDP-glucose 4,6-dehydratase|nr:dTDP-glucose 4,6-dehydratase [Clostridiales Family XIII bacterium]
MNQLITGGAGFIGANYLYYLAEQNTKDKIVCLDSLTYAGNLHTIDSLIKEDKITFVKGDITDRALVDKVLTEHQIDVIVHFAAESHVDRSIEDASAFLNTNILGTHVLLEAGRQHGISRFHQVSTDEVYGDLPLDRPDLLFTEETPIHTSSPYSASKASADLLVLAYFRTFRFPVTISRCSNNYGPYQFPEKLIPLMIANALADKKLPVYGKGENVRDWLHVRDHCRAIAMIVNDGKVGEVYNIGGHNERSNIQIVQTILQSLGKDESLIEYVTDRKGHDLRYAIDASKIGKELGWKPEIYFDEGIVSTIKWYLDNKPWWEEIVSGEYQAYYAKMYGGRS